MEKRLGTVLITVKSPENIKRLNTYLADYSDIIIARQGLPLPERNLRVISLIIDGSLDEIGALSGKIGRLSGIAVKTLLSKN